jgi:hypothetical protein
MKFKDNSSHDDDYLEFEIISNSFFLVLGKGQRVAQEKGPFVIKFKEPEVDKSGKINKNLETYFNIDGEFFKLINPDKIVIKLSE